VTYGLFGFHIQGHILFLTLVLLLGSILVNSIAFVMSEPSWQIILLLCYLRHVRLLLRYAELLPLAVSGRTCYSSLVLRSYVDAVIVRIEQSASIICSDKLLALKHVAMSTRWCARLLLLQVELLFLTRSWHVRL